MRTYINWRVAALVDKDVPALRRVFIPPFHHPIRYLGPSGISSPAWLCGSSTPDIYLPSCGCVLYLEYRLMSSVFFSGKAPDLAFLLRPAPGIVIVPHRPTVRTTPQADIQRDDLCRWSRILRHLIHEPIPSLCSLLGTLMVCTSVIRRFFST